MVDARFTSTTHAPLHRPHPTSLFAKSALTQAAKTPRARTLPENVLADVFGIEMVAEDGEMRARVKKVRRAR